IYAAANDLKVEWAVVKGVSSFAGSEDMTEPWQSFATAMAVSVIYNMFKYSIVLRYWPRNKETQDAKVPDAAMAVDSSTFVSPNETSGEASSSGNCLVTLRL
ncbi:Hypothetical predicted protein, partial [Paramuricea clavata]